MSFEIRWYCDRCNGEFYEEDICKECDKKDKKTNNEFTTSFNTNEARDC